MAAMQTWAQGESCSYQNSPAQLILTCSWEWGKKAVSTCLTEITWVSTAAIQALPFNVVPQQKHVPISIRSCRNCLRAQPVAFSESLAIGPGQLRVGNWFTLERQAIT